MLPSSCMPSRISRNLRQVFGGRAGAEGAVDTGFGKVAAVGAHLLHGLFVHVGVAGFDQVFGRAVHEAEVVAGLVGRGVFAAVPLKAQPFDRVHDAVDVFDVFLLGVGVVKAQVADAVVVARQAEVDADALGMADVQVAIGLGRKAGADLGRVRLALGLVGGVAWAAGPAAAGVGAFFQIGFDDLAQEVAQFDGFWGVGGGSGGAGRGGGDGHVRILIGRYSAQIRV